MTRLFAPGIEMMTKRSDFLAAAKASRAHKPGFVLQMRRRHDEGPARIGFTCSKKVGNAVKRNRAKRRLRAAARVSLIGLAKPGWDYVLIGRRDHTENIEFHTLCDDLITAVDNSRDSRIRHHR